MLANIFSVMLKDFRHYRSGMPDLVIWNPEDKNVKVIVKLVYFSLTI